MGVLAVDWSLAVQCEQPCAQASADFLTGYGFAKAAGDDPQYVQRAGREQRERLAKVADQHDPLIYLFLMFGFFFIWCVLTLLWKDVTLFDWCVFVFSRKRNDVSLRH